MVRFTGYRVVGHAGGQQYCSIRLRTRALNHPIMKINRIKLQWILILGGLSHGVAFGPQGNEESHIQ